MEQARLLQLGAVAERLDPEALAGRLARAAEAGRVRGDHDLNPDMTERPALREAAVLVALIDRPEGRTLLLTQRAAHLHAHAGQISFPGGGVEPQDIDPEAAALREAEEETGLPPALVRCVGRLDTYLTRTGFRIVPVVALVQPPPALRSDPSEVAEIFEVPLARILAADGCRVESHEVAGMARRYYAFPVRNRYIWGATAGMLVNLRDVLAPDVLVS